MSWTAVPQRACVDATIALVLWLDEQFTKVGRMVPSLTVDVCPHHNDSTPDTAIFCNWLYTMAILNRNHETGECPASNERQKTLCFAHFGKILDAANVGSQDLVRAEMFLRDFSAWLLATPHRLGRIPDPQCRPTRYTIRSEGWIVPLVATANLREG